MYKVYVDNEVFCDSRIDELAIVNPIITLEANAAGSFKFTIPSTHPINKEISRRKSVVSVYRDDEAEPTFQGVCVSIDKDFFNQKTVTCEGELTYLNDSVQRPFRYNNVTVPQLLTNYINNHNAQVDGFKQFDVGMVTVSDSNNSVYCYTNMQSTMAELKADLVDDYGGYIRVRYSNGRKYIDYLADSPNTSSQIIELGKNLIDYKSNLNSMNIATIVIPLGETDETQAVEGLDTRITINSVNDGKDYLVNDSAVANYGKISKTVTFDGVSTPDILKAKGQKYLEDVQFENVVIEASAIDFGYLSGGIAKFRLLDKIRVKSDVHGMDKFFILTKQVINLNEPSKDTITLGLEEKKTLTSQINETTQAMYKAMSQNKTPAIVESAILQATSLITGAEGGFVKINYTNDGHPFEILVMDTDDIATAGKVWRWNQNGLGYSSNGYNGPYGLAITMDGRVVATEVMAENLTGNAIIGKIFKALGRNAIDDNQEGIFVSPDGFSYNWIAYDEYTEEPILRKMLINNSGVNIDGRLIIPNSTRLSGMNLGYYTMIPTIVTNKVIDEDGNDLVNKETSIIQLTSNVSIPTATGKAVLSITLGPGTWLLVGRVRFATNATGYRRINFASTADSGNINAQVSAVNGSVTIVETTRMFTFTKPTTLYLNAYQTSGGNLDVASGDHITFIQATRLGY